MMAVRRDAWPHPHPLEVEKRKSGNDHIFETRRGDAAGKNPLRSILP
jgi:hypothetical protein